MLRVFPVVLVGSLLLALAACVGGPGPLPDQGSDQSSQGGGIQGGSAQDESSGASKKSSDGKSGGSSDAPTSGRTEPAPTPATEPNPGTPGENTDAG
jgi:hypothetical protein